MKRSALALLTLSACFSAVSCGYHDAWDGEFYLVGATSLGAEGDKICARVLILNESKKGEEAFLDDGTVQNKNFKSDAQWSKFSAQYRICEGGSGQGCQPASEAKFDPSEPAAPIDPGKIVTFVIPYSAAAPLTSVVAKNEGVPNELGVGVEKVLSGDEAGPTDPVTPATQEGVVESPVSKGPYFNLKVSIAVDKSVQTDLGDGTFQLGYENKRLHEGKPARAKDEVAAVEGVCGFEYHYRVRSFVADKKGENAVKYEKALTDLTGEERKL